MRARRSCSCCSKSYDTKRTPLALDSLRTKLAAYPGARIELREFENGPPIDAPIAMRLAGESLDTLRALAGRVEQALVQACRARSTS